MTRKAAGPAPGWLPPLVADLVCVLVFAFAGKASHEASESTWVVLAIAWPFALSLALAHTALLISRRPTRRVWPEGVTVLAVTYAMGMFLRVLSGRGVAGGFLVVAVLFLALALLGWRVVLRLAGSHRHGRTTG